ncbi:hypothetical protein OBBRIDRAFT_790511 [Obba rivulosa]|uniref:FHA domain-containing protein n=1 Tax=Obba rivulosa TaxID=1052685 RepID=A0A8E2DP66_9APHY|nr:hypothetical protein OBBRIDRAFT_790511 [Obba rivulosa]
MDTTDSQSINTISTAVHDPGTEIYTIRLRPDPASPDALQFEPITRDLTVGKQPVRLGRYFTKYGDIGVAANNRTEKRIAFMSMVVSRYHAHIWVEAGGKFFIKDEKSSSGTFIQGRRLSSEGSESLATELNNGDILQLGIPYAHGQESFHRCVKAVIEIESAVGTERTQEAVDKSEDVDADADAETSSNASEAPTDVEDASEGQGEPNSNIALPSMVQPNLDDFMADRPQQDAREQTQPERSVATRSFMKIFKGLGGPSLSPPKRWMPHKPQRCRITQPASQPTPSSGEQYNLEAVSSGATSSLHKTSDVEKQDIDSALPRNPVTKGRSTRFVPGDTVYARATKRVQAVPVTDTHGAKCCCF